MSELTEWVERAQQARVRGDDRQAALSWAMVTTLDPNSADARHNLGNALAGMGRLLEAAQNFLDALDLDPARADSRISLGSVLLDLGQTEDASAILDEALEIDPASVAAGWNKSLALLRKQEWKAGFRLFENRLLRPQSLPAPIVAPLWDGKRFDGPLCVWAEQGLGDVLHFARYLGLVQELAAKTILLVHPELVSLLAFSFPKIEVLAFGAPIQAERQIPLMSLAGLFGVFGPMPPYLAADPDRALAWSPRLDDRRLKVGLAWQGNPQHPADARRSFGLRALEPVLAIDGLRFISLQVGQADEPPALVENFTHRLTDFAETAAVLAHLDVVISPDTALAHLCGAMNKPCFAGLRIGGDWRWGDSGGESPWYPSLKLFRQEQLNDWRAPMAKMALALRALLALRAVP
ncbi:MAG: tetratricopeptide repeat protein [Rhodospirillales bacterium]|nr:tetratricopeptide repeat protein [Rhodospirillales bacterium]